MPTEAEVPFWGHVVLATTIATIAAAVPFWTHGLSLEVSTWAAIVIFPSALATYAFALRRG